MPPANVTATRSKTPKARGAKDKKRPTLDDVVEQLISLQGFGTSQDSSLLQMCDGGDMRHGENPVQSNAPIIGPFIGPIIGVDEAGRGCLAGPVVAAAVILPNCPSKNPQASSTKLKSQLAITPHLESLGLAGLADSKKLTEAQRDALAPRIRQYAVAWGLGVVWPSTIDEVNILQATFLAMARAVNTLRVQASLMLIDGNKTIPPHAFAASEAFRRVPLVDSNSAAPHAVTSIHNAVTRQHPVIGGDDIIPAISAASILAKTYRDKLMVTFDKQYPLYGFAKHKGYGTKDHLAALVKYGPCAQHRLTFRGVLPQTIDTGTRAKQASALSGASSPTPLLLC